MVLTEIGTETTKVLMQSPLLIQHLSVFEMLCLDVVSPGPEDLSESQTSKVTNSSDHVTVVQLLRKPFLKGEWI